MHVQGLTIALRPRSSWEAVDLGVALVRRHAKPIFLSWVLVTGCVFFALHALLLPLGLGWLAGLLFWWLKPAFDRIPLRVLSRAIMGEPPNVRDILRAQWQADWRPLLPWLLWRRLHPLRAMLLPVDVLEGERGPRRSERVRVLSAGEGSTPALLWIIGANLELVLWGSMIAFGLMLVPTEFLSDSAKAVFEAMFEQPPWWMQLFNNALYWIAMCVIEPFYIGAGFALYLNRRTQLEAWDIELAFRRLAARIGKTASAVLLLGLVAWSSSATASIGSAERASRLAPIAQPALPAVAVEAATKAAQGDDEIDAEQNEDDSDSDEGAHDSPVTPLSELFEEPAGESADAFGRAVQQTMLDPDLSPQTQRGQWRWRDQGDRVNEPEAPPAWLEPIGAFVAIVIENIFWIGLLIAVVLLLMQHRRWLPWILARRAPTPAPIASSILEHALTDALPDDLAGAVLALWQAGEARAALSLFYRGALVALVERAGSPLPPGATEAECLRLARRVSHPPFAAAFRRVVACWQAAAYAHRLPGEVELIDLLGAWRDAERSA